MQTAANDHPVWWFSHSPAEDSPLMNGLPFAGRARKMIRWLLPLWVYLGVVVVFAFFESILMYPIPEKSDGDWDPTWLGHQDLFLETSDGTNIHCWYAKKADAKYSILLFHGNGVHLGYMAERIAFLRDHHHANVLAIDYRGYGRSDGRPEEPGILLDAETAHTWLVENSGHPPEKIVLWGRSLGGAVAVHLASQRGAGALVLDRTFDSMVKVASNHFPWLPVRLVLRNRYPSYERIAHYDGPLFQVHGRADRVVAFERGAALFDIAPSKDKEFLESQTLTHNVPWPQSYHERLQKFLQQFGL